MEIELNKILLNSHNRNMKEKIVIFDDNEDFYIFFQTYFSCNRCNNILNCKIIQKIY